MRTRPNAETVGKLWVGTADRVYQQVAFSDCPTATFRPIDKRSPDETDLTVVVSSPIARNFTLLVPEDESP